MARFDNTTKRGCILEKKSIFLILGILGVITLPVKIIMQYINFNSVRSTVFAIIFSACILAMMLLSSQLSKNSKVDYSFRNMPLTAVSAICSVMSLWTSISYFNGTPPSDAKVRYLFVAIFCALLSLFFALVCCSHYSGKNAFRVLQILIFTPVIMYILSLTLFFSFELTDYSAYNVLAQSLTLLFFVYYSHFYVKCSEKNFRKRCLAFGIPAVVVNLCHFIPTAISSSIGSPTSTFSILSISISAYILLFLVNDIKLSDDNVETKKVTA